MPLPSPLTMTIDGETINLERISSSENSSTYADADNLTRIKVSHAYGKRTRRVYRLDLTKTGPNPLLPDQNMVYSAAVYVVIDHPKTGFTATELAEIAGSYLTTMEAQLPKIVTGQN